MIAKALIENLASKPVNRVVGPGGTRSPSQR